MKYLLISQTRMDWNQIRESIEENSYAFYYLETVKRGRTQIVFPNKDLTVKLAQDIAQMLNMTVKSIGKRKVILDL